MDLEGGVVIRVIGLALAALIILALPSVPAQASSSEGRPADNTSAGADNGDVHARESTAHKKRPPGARPPAVKKPTLPDITKLPRVCLVRSVLKCDKEPPAKAAPKHRRAESVAREVAARLRLPDPTPRLGPDPSVNEWDMLVVGFPIWLWTDRPTRLSTTVAHDGLTIRLAATWASTTFTMGDGHSVECAATSVYQNYVVKPGTPSPTCGYTYSRRSPEDRPYPITAATHWRIDWSTGGEHGTFVHTWSGSRTLVVGELHALIDG